VDDKVIVRLDFLSPNGKKAAHQAHDDRPEPGGAPFLTLIIRIFGNLKDA